MKLEEKVFKYFMGEVGIRLPELMEDLFRVQLRDWPQFAENHAGLKKVRHRKVSCGTHDVKLQWNPKRITSTSAAVGDASAPERPCFLCLENLPPPQTGILCRERYMILCNPMPILDRHFTIAGVRHAPQTLDGAVEDMLLLSRDMGPEFVLFYNGAQCGASAPDHLHFQACPASDFPGPGKSNTELAVRLLNGVMICQIQGQGRGAMVLEGRELESLSRVFSGLLKAAQRLLACSREPMINTVSHFREGTWRLSVYPRKRHRPAAFFAADEKKRLLISPGALDMSGLIILPIRDHFERVTARDVWDIYGEVSYDDLFIQNLIAQM